MIDVCFYTLQRWKLIQLVISSPFRFLNNMRLRCLPEISLAGPLTKQHTTE